MPTTHSPSIALPTLISAHGRRALADAAARGWTLSSYASPVEDAREGLTAEEAVEIAHEDAGLIVARAPEWLVEGARIVAGRGADRDQGRIVCIAWEAATATVAWDQGVTTEVSLLAIEDHDSQSDATTIYALTYRADSELPADLPGEGTLAEACEIAAAYNTKIKLSDPAGFARGLVYPDGSYRLT